MAGDNTVRRRFFRYTCVRNANAVASAEGRRGRGQCAFMCGAHQAQLAALARRAADSAVRPITPFVDNSVSYEQGFTRLHQLIDHHFTFRRRAIRVRERVFKRRRTPRMRAHQCTPNGCVRKIATNPLQTRQASDFALCDGDRQCLGATGTANISYFCSGVNAVPACSTLRPQNSRRRRICAVHRSR